MKSPLLALASCFALGILVARFWSFSDPSTALLLATLCLLGGLGSLRRGWARTAGTFALTGFVVAGISASGVFQNRFPPDHVRNLADRGIDLNQDVELEGVIVSAPVRTGSGFTIDLACRRVGEGISSRAVQGKVRIRLFTPPDRDNWAQL